MIRIRPEFPCILSLFIFSIFCPQSFCETPKTDPYRTIAILEDQRSLKAEPDIKLSSFFKSDDSAIRARAVLAAGRIGNKKVISELQPLLADPSSDVRKMTAFALGQFRAKEGLPLILELMKDPDREVRRLAIETAGRTASLEVSSAVARFLEDPDIMLSEQAALALALIKDKNTAPVLMKKAAGIVPAQWSYVYALYRLADPRSIQVLQSVLNNPVESKSTGDPSSVLFALKALWAMKAPLADGQAERLLKSDDERIVQNALDVLGASGDQSKCDLIYAGFAEMNTQTKMKAVEAIGSLQCESDERAAAILAHPDVTVRAASIHLIPKTEREAQKSLFEKRAVDPNWQIRWRTALAAAGLESKTAIPLLSRLAKDSDSMVRLAAIESLGEYMPETAEILIPLLKSNDFAERSSAADILGKSNDPALLPALIEAYELSSDPGEVEGRVAILDALSNFNDSTVLSVYEKALKDPEITIRRHAIDAIKKLTGNTYFHNGKLVDPEDFLYPDRTVTDQIQKSYPPDFGTIPPDYLAEIVLDKGTIVVRLLSKEAPNHVKSFVKLAESKFYDGLRIHRVVPNFVIQGGDPRGDGWGGGGVSIRDEANLLLYKRGMVGMPLAGKDTGGSQFFITMSRQPHLDGNYTIFGEVVSGMEFVDSTEPGDRIQTVRIKNSPDNTN